MATDISDIINSVWADGPSSQPYEPSKPRIRQEFGQSLQSIIDQIRGLIGLGLQLKTPVRAATAPGTNVNLATISNGATFGGVTVATGDRIGAFGQTTASQNGILIVQASGAPVRATDADASLEMLGMTAYVIEGTNAGKVFSCTAPAVITPDVTALPFVLLMDTSSLNAAIASLQATVAYLQGWNVATGSYVEGQYTNPGTGAAVADASYWLFSYSVTADDLSFRASGTTSGSAMALAVYVASGIVVGSQYAGIDATDTPYVATALTVPPGTTHIYLGGKRRTDLKLEVKRLAKTLPADVSAVTEAVGVLNAQFEDGSAWNVAFPTVTANGQLVDKDTGLAAANASWKILTYKISPLDLELRATALVAAPSTALAVYIDAVGAVLRGHEFAGPGSGSTQYTNQPLTIPAGTTDVILCGLIGSPVTLEVRRASTESDYWERPAQTIQAGMITDRTTGAITSNASWSTVKIPLTGTEKGLRATAIVAAGSTALATYYDASDTVIGSEYNGADGTSVPIVNARLNPPANARWVAGCGLAYSLVEFQVLNAHTNLGQRIGAPALARAYEKTGVLFGTSIPSGGPIAGSYANKGADMIGLRLYNEGVGSSMIRRGFKSLETVDDPYGWTGATWQNVAYSLGQTIAEKDELITNWVSKWRDLLVGSDKPTTLDPATQAFWRDCSFENRLVARHLGANRRGVYVLSHGHNDRKLDDLSELYAVPTDFFDRGTFIGACNFMIDKILSDDPHAHILLEGHYEIARKVEVSQAQIALANLWNFPLLRLWDKLGWSQRSVTSGGVTKTMTQWAMPDDLHPHSDLTGAANDRIAPLWARFVSENM